MTLKADTTYTDPSLRHFVSDLFSLGDEDGVFLATELVRAKACRQITDRGLENTEI